jgi:hypothetical protein
LIKNAGKISGLNREPGINNEAIFYMGGHKWTQQS